jgi:hypothetical protein
MDDEDDDFDGRKRAAYEDINEDAQEQYSPKEKRAVPAFSSISPVDIV